MGLNNSKIMENSQSKFQKMKRKSFFSRSPRSDFTKKYLPKMVSSSDFTEKSQMPPMNDILMKYPHLGDKIFKLMDPQDIQNCKEVSRTWYVAILIQDYSKPNPGLPPKCLIT